jgi:hypothetical protein
MKKRHWLERFSWSKAKSFRDFARALGSIVRGVVAMVIQAMELEDTYNTKLLQLKQESDTFFDSQHVETRSHH